MSFDSNITVAAIATLVSALTSTCVTLWIASSNKKKNLDDQLDAILKIALQYPYLENSHFTSSWKPENSFDDEKYMRYDIYCNLLFNFLSRICDYHKYDKNRIENYITIKDWVRHHGEFWKNPVNRYENVDSYDREFVDLINSYLK